MAQQFTQKKSIQLILLKTIKKYLCYLFVNGTEIDKFKAKDSEIGQYSLCIRNISKDFSVDDIKKSRIKWIYLRF